MFRKKIGLLAVGALVIVGAAMSGGAGPSTTAANEPTTSPAPSASTATASASPSLAPGSASPSATPAAAALTGTVTEVVDGDTIRVELPSGLETVRIIGIDTPRGRPSHPARGMLRRRGDGLREGDPRRQDRHARGRSDPGRARQVRPTAGACLRRRHAVHRGGDRWRLRDPLHLRAAEQPRRRTRCGGNYGQVREARDLGALRRPGRPAGDHLDIHSRRHAGRNHEAEARSDPGRRLPSVVRAMRARHGSRPRLLGHRIPGPRHRP